MNFTSGPSPADLTRDLAVYEPQVLIHGIDEKTRELAALEEAIPSFDSMLRYVGGEAHGAIEATPADLGLLNLANGHRSVRRDRGNGEAESARGGPLAGPVSRAGGAGTLAAEIDARKADGGCAMKMACFSGADGSRRKISWRWPWRCLV